MKARRKKFLPSRVQGISAIQGRPLGVAEFSKTGLETVKTDGELLLRRGCLEGYKSPVLIVESVFENPSLNSIQRLEHEYALSGELDAAWAARPIALARQHGRTILVLEDPGGVLSSVPLDCLLSGLMRRHLRFSNTS
jgi:hypothetical protein